MQGNNSPRFIFTPFALLSGQIYCWAISNILNFIFLTLVFGWIQDWAKALSSVEGQKIIGRKKTLYTLYSSMSINLNDQKKKLQLGKQHKFV